MNSIASWFKKKKRKKERGKKEEKESEFYKGFVG